MSEERKKQIELHKLERESLSDGDEPNTKPETSRETFERAFALHDRGLPLKVKRLLYDTINTKESTTASPQNEEKVTEVFCKPEKE